MSAILARHCGRYPLLKSQDIYKLVHQGVFGPGHIIASATAARRALATECRLQSADCIMQNGGDEELVEPIDPDGRLVRVNLRSMLRQGGRMRDECGKREGGSLGADIDWLIEALLESARRVKGEPVQMKRRLAAAVRWCRTNRPRQAAELERIVARAGESGYPAFHHSPAYNRAYRPAYRVILSDCLKPRASGRAG